MQEFMAKKLELVAAGKVFTSEDLAQLSYPDVKRASIGDAGAAACSQELVDAEIASRLERYAHVTPARFSEFTQELERQGMYMDVCRKVFPTPPAAMDWVGLPTNLRAYFLIRCLRAHVDQPGPRLGMLVSELDHLLDSPQDSQDMLAAARILRAQATSLREAVDRGEVLELQAVRHRLTGFDLLLSGLTPVSRAAVLSLTLRGYHCSAGCFLPAETRPRE